jgi:hypothetical protein
MTLDFHPERKDSELLLCRPWKEVAAALSIKGYYKAYLNLDVSRYFFSVQIYLNLDKS